MQLLKTKFHIPRINTGSTVSRERLRRQIGDTSPLVLISAPAGYGKTTLLSEWAEESKSPVGWVSLEQSEDNPELFWRYFLTAVVSASGGCGEHALEQIRSAGISSIETILTGVINDVAEKGAGFTLILDDYHVITDALIHGGMAFFIDHQPENMRLIIAGREKPQLALSKYRVSGILTEIRAVQFKFSTHETECFLNNIHGLNLDMDDLASLTQKTEGWVAGLALAVLSMRESEDRHAFVRSFTGSHRYVIDYLIEEVLAGLDEDVRTFMLKLSVLERFCPELCASVTDHPESRSLVTEMAQNNLFLIPLDDERQWFRYHHLFRDVLLKNLEQNHGGDIPQLHRKAFCWLKESGFHTEAFHHGILGGAYPDAAETLAEHAPDLYDESGGLILQELMGRLPGEVVLSNPVLCCYHVLLDVFAGHFDRIELLEQERFRGNGLVSGFQSLLKSYQYFYQDGEFEKCIDELNICLKLIPERHRAALGLAGLLLSLSLRYSGDIVSAYEEVKDISLDHDIPVLKAISYVDILVGMGRLQDALTFIDRTMEKGHDHYGENLFPEYGYLLVVKAGILRERDEISEALKLCRKGLELGRDKEFVEFTFLGNLEYARILTASGNVEEAQKALETSTDAARSSSTWGEGMCLAHQARMEMGKGHMVQAWHLLKDIVDPKVSEIPYRKHSEYLSYCRYCLGMNEPETVHQLTDRMISEDLAVHRDGRLVECYILKAMAFHVQNNTENALGTLEKAFAVSSKEGFVRVYIDEGDTIRMLFRQALEKGTLPDYLKPYATTPASAPGLTRSVMINEFKEGFNEREIEILSLMKQGCSNKNIADTLFLSVNTVRWYASRIFGKLNVKRRGEAVAFAEKYELI